MLIVMDNFLLEYNLFHILPNINSFRDNSGSTELTYFYMHLFAFLHLELKILPTRIFFLYIAKLPKRKI